MERRERVEKLNALANILAVNAVIALEDEEDEIFCRERVENLKALANILAVNAVIASEDEEDEI
jgi:nitrate reductase NapAB chaperone NapD